MFQETFTTFEELRALKIICENSLKAYIKLIHKELTQTDFTFKPFHEKIIEHLENIASYKTTKNLLINIPVGFGKSKLVEYFISWCFARNKNLTFLYTSYSDSLIMKHSSEIKDIMLSGIYRTLWDYSFQKDKNSKANWSIEGAIGRSGLTAASMGGTITGLDAGNPSIEGFCGACIIDDPLKATDAIYDVAKEDCIYKFESGLKTRLRRSDVPIICIMQRLDPDDLSGHILKNEKENWDLITVKALENEKSVWEEKISTAELIKKRDLTPWVFYPQFQQEPDTEINLTFQGYVIESDEKFIYNGIGHVDKGFDGKDGTAFTLINKIGEIYYVFGKHYPEKHIDDCLNDIKFWRNKFKCGSIATEKNDDKGYTARNNEGFYTYSEPMNKHIKIMTYIYPNWKNIRFIKGTDESYIKQIQRYKEKVTHDDCPDSLASAIRLLEQQTKYVGKRLF